MLGEHLEAHLMVTLKHRQHNELTFNITITFNLDYYKVKF